MWAHAAPVKRLSKPCVRCGRQFQGSGPSARQARDVAADILQAHLDGHAIRGTTITEDDEAEG